MIRSTFDDQEAAHDKNIATAKPQKYYQANHENGSKMNRTTQMSG